MRQFFAYSPTLTVWITYLDHKRDALAAQIRQGVRDGDLLALNLDHQVQQPRRVKDPLGRCRGSSQSEILHCLATDINLPGVAITVSQLSLKFFR